MSCECLRQCHLHYCTNSTTDPGNYMCVAHREPIGGCGRRRCLRSLPWLLQADALPLPSCGG
jgi:hypothetical protein